MKTELKQNATYQFLMNTLYILNGQDKFSLNHDKSKEKESLLPHSPEFPKGFPALLSIRRVSLPGATMRAQSACPVWNCC